LRAALADTLAAFHRDHPRQPGMEMESLRSQLAAELPPKVFRAIIAQLGADGDLVRTDSVVRLPAHRTGLGQDDAELAQRVVAHLSAAGLTPPDVKQLASELGLAPARLSELLPAIERTGRIARTEPDLYFAADALERARDVIRSHIAAHGEITAAAFRDAIHASRKFSIALLNYFDRTGFTLRVGDTRKLRRG
jgi:selenocysteine-specific elongation factor